MTSDVDIYRTASVLIREHEDEADLVAAQRADSFLEAGDMDGSAVWRRVLKANKEIKREEPKEGEAVNLPLLGAKPDIQTHHEARPILARSGYF